MGAPLASCMGPWAAHCQLAELQTLLQSCPLAQPEADATRRLGQALTLGSVASCAPARCHPWHVAAWLHCTA